MGGSNNENLYCISPLDANQNNAILELRKSEALAIIGENGTGKIETLVNIVSDSLYRKKRVIIIVENKDKLYEIESRLSKIKELVLCLEKDSSYLNEKFKEIDINNRPSTVISKVTVITRDIEKKIDRIKKINNILTKKRECGLSLIEMYSLTNKSITKSDDRYGYFKVFRDKRPLEDYCYSEILTKVKEFQNSNTVDKYIKYKRFNNNRIFTKLKKTITKEEIELAIKKLNKIIDNHINISLQIQESKYTNDLLESFKVQQIISEDELRDLAKIVNVKYNYEKYNLKEKISWWQKSKKANKEERLNKFNMEEEKILNEYLENIKYLKLYIESIEFVKEIVQEDEFREILNNLLEGEEVSDYLETLKSTLEIYESFRTITEDINLIGNMEREMLEYCYGNSDSRFEMENLIGYLPEMKILLTIEDIEKNEKEEISIYNDYERLIEDIIADEEIKEELIPEAIRSVWNDRIINRIDKKIYTNDKFTNLKNEREITNEELLHKYKDIIYDMYPCMLVTKDSFNKMQIQQRKFAQGIIYGKCICEELRFSKIVYFSNENYNFKDEYIRLKNKYCEIEKEKDKSPRFYSDHQKELYKVISKKGYIVYTNFELGGYTLDLVIFDKENQNFIKAIECDELIYQDDYEIFKSEISKRRFIKKYGWNIIRTWTRDWWMNKKEVLDDMKQILI